jgi:predicted DsbA family dithiol-disulfide isomerase
MRIEIWSDVVCPWCYIGKRRFELALARFPHRDGVDVVYRSFQLDPSASAAGSEPVAEHLARKYGTTAEQATAMMSRVEGVAASVGLEYHLDRTLSGNTRDAHRVLHLARARGREGAVLERLFRAYFAEGQSLFDHPTLVRLGAEAGLDPAEAQAVLDGDAYAADVEADVDAALALGVQGVPFFVVDGRYGISGAQPEELFTRALTLAWEERHAGTASPDTGVGAGETDLADEAVCADGCCDVPEPAGGAVGGDLAGAEGEGARR